MDSLFSSENSLILDYLDESGSLEPVVCKLVGKGEEGISAGCKCGTLPLWTHNCSNSECMFPLHSLNHCKKKSCPICYPIWLKARKQASSTRLLSQKAKNRNRGKRLTQMYVSKDNNNDTGTVAELKMNVKDALRYAKRKGWRGGVMLIHLFRVTEEAKLLAKEAGKAVWEWIREQECEWHFYFYSPHIHLLGYIGHMRSPRKGEKFIYGVKSDVRNRPVDYLKDENPYDAVEGVARYLLSHTGYFVDNPGSIGSYNWAGNCSRRRFRTSREEREGARLVPKPCPICGAPVVSSRVACRIYYADRDAGYDLPKYMLRESGAWWHPGAGSVLVEYE